MTRPLPIARKIDRKKPDKETPKTKLVIVCEGQSTEPHYIQSFLKDNNFDTTHLELIPLAGAPMTVVNRAIQEKNLLARERRLSVPYEIWAVFDRDAHPFVDEARQKAKSNNIKVAFSNPCIELWALYHFHDQQAYIHRADAAKALHKVMPKYDPNGSKLFDYEQMKKGYQIACKRAKQGRNDREEEDTPHDNPSTSMDELMQRIETLAQE